MKENPNSIFDSMYVGGQITDKPPSNKPSEMKEFLKSPIAVEDIERYGTSKPYRVVINARIQHGKG